MVHDKHLKFTVIALYGFNVSTCSAATFYDEMLRWFEACDCLPDRLGVHGKGFPGKLTAFQRMHAKLKKTHFADVECLEIHSRPPKQTPRVVDGGMSVDFSLRDSYWVFSAGSSMLATDQLLDIAHTSIRYLKPPYGIGYQRDQKHGPVFYALGINFSYGPTDEFSGPEYDAAVRVSHWTDAMDERVYMQGILRDIYPYNFLTEPQLTRNVGVKPLNDWISTDSSRGELSHFEGDVWLWSVPDEQIPTLRDELRQHGMIFGLKPDR